MSQTQSPVLPEVTSRISPEFARSGKPLGDYDRRKNMGDLPVLLNSSRTIVAVVTVGSGPATCLMVYHIATSSSFSSLTTQALLAGSIINRIEFFEVDDALLKQ